MAKLMIFNDRWCPGGVEALWFNLLSFFPNDGLDIVLLVGQKETDIYDALLQRKNIRMVVINETVIVNPIKRNLKIKKELKRILKKENPDILHINVCNAIGLLYAKKAKQCKVPCVIVHSHNTCIEHDKLKIKRTAHFAMRCLYKKYPDYRVACSTEAGMFMFGKHIKFSLIKNGVNLQKFQFKDDIRTNFRRAHGIGDETKVFCHIGRFAEQKNHKFLIDLYSEIVNKEPDSKLLLVGEGSLLEGIRNQVLKRDLSDKVIFMGVTSHTEDVYFASDYFVLPSLHEGLPVTAIEAQATGIICFLASTISQETKVVDNCYFFSLNADLKELACKIISTENRFNRSQAVEVMSSKGYSIEDIANNLYKFYLGITSI